VKPTKERMKIERTGTGLTIEVASEAETEQVARTLAQLAQPGTVIGLAGPLGAGKTRLVRALAEALGVDPGAIASPTFVLIHEYEGRVPVVHCDVYRLPGADEFEALGVDEYWNGGGVCLIEWADRVADRLPAGAWFLQIEPLGVESRRIVLALPRKDLLTRLEALFGGGAAPGFDPSSDAN
jgi:tRNA threonylcarbamoyladenosine biosynthesis protein TsaE